MMALLAAGEFPIATGDVVLHRINQLTRKGAPLDWVRSSPVLFTGGSIVLSKYAPHPNASYLWLDWLFSPAGIKALDEIATKGSPFPGSGSQQAAAVKGLSFIREDESYGNQNKEFKKNYKRPSV